MATTTETPWQDKIVDQAQAAPPDPSLTHAVVYLPADRENDEPDLLDRCDSHTAALVSAEDWATKCGPGEILIVPLDDLRFHGAEVRAEAIQVEPRRQNEETAQPERELEQLGEDAPDEGGEEEEAVPVPQPGEQAAAFDAADYDREDLQIPKVDGQPIDRISVKFAGEVFLDRSEPSDVAVYNALRLGKDVQLLVEARCSQTAAKGATDRDGDLDVVVGTKGLKVHTLLRPAGADWIEEA